MHSNIIKGVLMGIGNNGKYDLQLDSAADGGASTYRATFSNAHYNRTLSAEADGIDGPEEHDAGTFPIKGGSTVNARLEKISGTGTAFAECVVTFFKNLDAMHVFVIPSGNPVDVNHIYTGLAEDDDLIITVTEGP